MNTLRLELIPKYYFNMLYYKIKHKASMEVFAQEGLGIFFLIGLHDETDFRVIYIYIYIIVAPTLFSTRYSKFLRNSEILLD